MEERWEEIRRAQPLTSDPAVIQASVLMVQAEVDQLRALMPNLERFDQAREQLFQQHPDQPVFDSLPGPGPALAPRLGFVAK